MPKRRTSCLPNFTVSPSETAKPCEVPVPLVSESVWANAGTAAVQSTISADQTLTFRSLNSKLSKFRAKAHFGLKTFGDDCVPSGSRSL